MSKIGLQLFNIRSFLTTPEDVKYSLKKVKELGYNVVQISGLKSFKDEAIINTFVEECKSLNLKVCVTHIPYDLLDQDFDYVVEMHKKLNCEYVGIGRINLDVRDNPTIEGYRDFALKMEEFANRLEEHGLKLVYHNHEFEFHKVNGKVLFDVLVENTSKLIFELDVHWLHRAGQNILKVIKRLENRIDIIHLKDYAIYHAGTDTRSEIRFAEIGEGSLDFNEIIDLAVECGALYMLIEQDDSYGKDPFECAKTSYDNLVKLGYYDLLKE